MCGAQQSVGWLWIDHGIESKLVKIKYKLIRNMCGLQQSVEWLWIDQSIEASQNY